MKKILLSISLLLTNLYSPFSYGQTNQKKIKVITVSDWMDIINTLSENHEEWFSKNCCGKIFSYTDKDSAQYTVNHVQLLIKDSAIVTFFSIVVDIPKNYLHLRIERSISRTPALADSYQLIYLIGQKGELLGIEYKRPFGPTHIFYDTLQSDVTDVLGPADFDAHIDFILQTLSDMKKLALSR